MLTANDGVIGTLDLNACSSVEDLVVPERVFSWAPVRGLFGVIRTPVGVQTVYREEQKKNGKRWYEISVAVRVIDTIKLAWRPTEQQSEVIGVIMK